MAKADLFLTLLQIQVLNKKFNGQSGRGQAYSSIRIKIVVTFKSSHCRYFKNCIRRKCEGNSIPTSAKLRWGVETRPPRGRILTRGRGVGKMREGFNPPNPPGNSNTALDNPSSTTSLSS